MATTMLEQHVAVDDSTLEPTDSHEHLTPCPSRGQEHANVSLAQSPAEEMDGGLWAWLRVFAAWLLFLMTWGPALSYGTFQNYYSSTLLPSESDSNLSWVGATSTTLLIVGGAVAGPLFDRGYLKPLMILGSILQILGFMTLSLAKSYYQVFLAQGLTYGLGCGLVYIPALAFVTTSFKKRRALAVGITTTGSSVGGIIFPVMFRNLLPEVGFPWTCRVIAFVQLSCALIGFGLLYRAPVRRTKPRQLLDWTAFKSLPFNLFFITNWALFNGYWVPLFYIPVYATGKLGTSVDLAVYLTVILNGASAFGRVIPAFAVDRYGAAEVVTVATIIATILMFCWIAVNSVAGYIVWCIVFGFVTGVFVSANPIVVMHPSIAPTTEIVGTRLGMLFFSGGIGALIGGPISGALLRGSVENFLNVQGYASAVMGIGAVCMSGVLWATLRWDRLKRRGEKSDAGP